MTPHQTPPGEPTPLVRARWLRNIRGFSTIPLDSPLEPIAANREQAGKVPIVKWAAYQDTLPDEDTLRRWFGNGHKRNIAIVTGKISGIVAVDLDSPEALTWARAHLPETPIRTLTAKGEHWFYRHPGVPVSNKAKIRTTDQRLELDIRGDGGFVVAPGSLHATGIRYQALGDWGVPLEQLPVFDPTWIAPTARPAVRSTSARRAAADSSADTRMKRARAYLAHTPPAIQGQGGDEHTFQVCCRLVRGFDLSDAEALEVLGVWNQCNVPSWTEAELASKIDGARKYGTEPIGGRLDEPLQARPLSTAVDRPAVPERARVAAPQPSAPGARFALTDLGNAEVFAAVHGSVIRFDHTRQHFLRFDCHTWTRDADAEVHRLLHATIRGRLDEAKHVEDVDDRKAVVRWALASESRGRLDAALALAQTLRPIADAGEGWDADPWLLGCPNGVLNLRTGELRPGRPDDRISLSVAVAFDPDAEATRFGWFYEDLFEDPALRDYVHRALGYSITGDTSEQVLFVPHGRGSNGKSTLIRTIAATLGDVAHTVPFSTFLHQPAGGSSVPNDIASLVGRRFVTAGEVDESGRFNEARLKGLSGGDVISARFMRAEFFSFRPVCKLWLCVNHKPIVRDDSHAFWRRVQLIPFTRTFDINKTLEPALLEERQGILAWLVRGCLAWQERGLDAPPTVTDATADYQADSDPLGEFLGTACEVDEQAEVSAGDLFAHYRTWAERQGLSERERLSQTAFGRRMSERFRKVRTQGGNSYQGLSRRHM